MKNISQLMGVNFLLGMHDNSIVCQLICDGKLWYTFIPRDMGAETASESAIRAAHEVSLVARELEIPIGIPYALKVGWYVSKDDPQGIMKVCAPARNDFLITFAEKVRRVFRSAPQTAEGAVPAMTSLAAQSV